MNDAKFSQLVTNLAKPGAEILVALSPEDTHKAHMIIGIAGGLMELQAALRNQDTTNVYEELGDLEFYLRGLEHGYGMEIQTYENYEGEKSQCPLSDHVEFLADHIERAYDLVKKQVIYKKEIDEAELAKALDETRYQLMWVYNHFGISRSEILVRCYNKLSKRYSSGSYSDAQAQERADKK